MTVALIERERNIFPSYPDRFGVKLSDLKGKFRTMVSKGLVLEDRFNSHSPVPVSTVIWRKDNFELVSAIRQTTGPLVEVAGPTTGTVVIDFSKLGKNIFVSNAKPGLSVFDDKTEKFLGYFGRIDFQAEAQNLPLVSGGVGALFVSCLHLEARREFAAEAIRVLEAGGLLIYQVAFTEDVEVLKSKGLEIVEYQKRVRDGGWEDWDVVFQKPFGKLES